MSEPHQSTGVVFPTADTADGRRSTTALGRAVVADALRRADPVGSASAARETNWRQGYLPHFRRLIEAGLPGAEAAHSIARDGLASLHERMRWVGPSGEGPLATAFESSPTPLVSETIRGEGAPDRTISMPYAAERASGDTLRRVLAGWVDAGVVEPTCAEAVERVMANPDWLDLSDQTVVVLGAAAEMGPLRTLLRWGADVVAVDLPRKELWQKLIADTRRLAGSMTVPARPGGEPVEGRLGGDLIHDLGSVTQWVTEREGRLVLGNYVYADGETNVRVSTAVDALTQRVVDQRGHDVALAFLATPTDVFAVPGGAVARSVENYAQRHTSKVLRVPLRTLSGGRLLRRNYVPGEDPGINDWSCSSRDRTTCSRSGSSGGGRRRTGPMAASCRSRWRRRRGLARSSRTGRSRRPMPARTDSESRSSSRAPRTRSWPSCWSTTCAPARRRASTHGRTRRTARPTAGCGPSAYDPRSALGIAALLGFAAAR